MKHMVRPVAVHVCCLLASCSLSASDWPTYMGDYARSGITVGPAPDPLIEQWRFQSVHPPQPAWGDEAKWDGYNKIYDLKARQTFDRAFQVAVVGNRLFFGSSADDKIYCLDASTGNELWSFFTEGPVRLAPTVVDGRVYVGSDDGYAYCLSADEGKVVWKTRLGPREHRIPGNGRVISAWPARTGLIVGEGLVYGGAGMFPSEGVFLCALDAQDGSIKWRQQITDLPAQGYLLASSSRLYVPTGRNNPIVFDRVDGRRVATLEGAGGAYALLVGDALVFGPGKKGELGLVTPGHTDQLASFAGNHMLVGGQFSFLHSDTELSALDRTQYMKLMARKRELTRDQQAFEKKLKSAQPDSAPLFQNELARVGAELDDIGQRMEGCVPWRQPCRFPFSLIMAGETIFAGGDQEVGAFAAANGRLHWSAKVKGKVYGLAAAGGRLFVSTDRGAIHCFGARANL